MTDIHIIGSIFFVGAGLFFLLIGSLGIVRLPDFYSRTHATSKSDTLGLLLVITGLSIYEGWNLNTAKFFLISVFIALANPIGAHALARAANLRGIKPLLRDNQKENSQ